MGSHRCLRSGRAPGTLALRTAVMVACLLFPGVTRATGFLAYELGKTCLHCHAARDGRGSLTERGREAHAQGYRFARDPALTVACEGAPLSPGGVSLLTRRYRELGRKLFHLEEVGSTGKACVSCHVPGQGIEDAWLAYPKPRQDAGEWWTVEQAVNDCLVKRQGTRPLGHGSRSSVALQLYLRDMAEADHDSLALHPRLTR